MSSVLFIKNADFSANAVEQIVPTTRVLLKNGSADEGTVTSGTGSEQTRFWFPFVPTQGKTYKAVLSVTNGSSSSSPNYTDLCAVRFVATSSDKTGQDIIPVVHVDGVDSVEEYTVEGNATCNGTYGYVYLNINWALEQPTKYPNFVLSLYDISE